MGDQSATREQVVGRQAGEDGGVRVEEAELHGRWFLRGRKLIQHEIPGD